MDNTELIENFFKNNLSDEEKAHFDQRILDDSSFADEVAFYIASNNSLREGIHENKKLKFKEIYDNQKVVSIKAPVRNLWKYAAAASVLIAVVLITWIFTNKTSPPQLADNYIKQNWQTLPVIMGAQDSLQMGIKNYNEGKLKEALPIFEMLSKTHPENMDAKKYTGIVYLQMSNYDKALQYFTEIEADTNLYSNPGKFDKAITLLKRNNKGDADEAKRLLNEVVNNNLDGKDEAEEFLKKWN